MPVIKKIEEIGGALPGTSAFVDSQLKKFQKDAKVFRDKEGPGWSNFKWRPLVSYRNHRWKKLLSMLSRF